MAKFLRPHEGLMIDVAIAVPRFHGRHLTAMRGPNLAGWDGTKRIGRSRMEFRVTATRSITWLHRSVLRRFAEAAPTSFPRISRMD